MKVTLIIARISACIDGVVQTIFRQMDVLHRVQVHTCRLLAGSNLRVPEDR